MEYAVLAVGLVLIVEGLVYALAPSLIEDLLNAMRQIPVETRRLIGLGCLALGVAFVWLASAMGGLG